jgi:hypothetical protein
MIGHSKIILVGMTIAISFGSVTTAQAQPNATASAAPSPPPNPLATPATLSVIGQVLVIADGYLVFTTGDAVKLDPSLKLPAVRLGQFVRVLIDRTSRAITSIEVEPHSLASGDVEAAKLPRDLASVSPKSRRGEIVGGGAVGQLAHSVTITITARVPDNTPSADDVYLATDRTNFAPAEIRMIRLDARTWTTSLQVPSGAQIRYEFTRGNFATIERDKRGGIVEPRRLTAADNVQTHDTVAHWADIS